MTDVCESKTIRIFVNFQMMGFNSMEVTGYMILLASLGISEVNGEGQCNTQPVNAVFCLDATTNVLPEQRQSMFEFIASISETLPDGSDGSCSYVNDVNTGILRFKSPTANTNLTKQLEKVYEIPEATGRKIMSNALENEVKRRFTVSDYKNRAELFYLILTDATDIENFPAILSKKKVYVIIIGKSVPNRLRNFATSGNHTFLITDLKDVKRVATHVSQQTCKDSYFKCDVDKYMQKKLIKCKTCMNVCSSVTETQSMSCMSYCPYIQIPPKEGAVKTQDISELSTDVKIGNQAKETTIISIACVLSVTAVVVVVYVVVYKVCRLNRLACFSTNPVENNHNQLLEMQHLQSVVTVSDAVQETGNPNEPDADRGNDNASHALLHTDASCDGTDRGVNAEGFSIPFKNNKELDMNGEVFREPAFQNVH